MGITIAPNNDITYREWAPNAVTAHFIGDFSEKNCLFAVRARAIR
jgi:1,4-alpha-glucan branching enzyme